jgi:hypothetical protein
MKDFQLEPAAFVSRGAGQFDLTLYTTPAQDGSMEFPSLTINRDPYESMPVSFAGAIKDEKKREITLNPITLKPQPIYNKGNAFKSPITPVHPGQGELPQ